ncbi:MAG: beta-ketoacyl-ACP synthase II [Methylococcales bacterium]|nr:beta-ketoacyl-ACP synthase II [Methylococcales bacterium]MBT7410034.1 beta-ketoacyl-ACP synthase II [Methylococcales bacterium]
MAKKRVVITGLGAITPVGLNVPDTWSNILNGVSGVRPITSFDVSKYGTRFGGSIVGFDVENYCTKKDAKKMGVFIHYGMAASIEAFLDSGLEVTEKNAERIGVAIGSGIGGIQGIENGYGSYLKSGPRRISPFFVPSNIINMIAGNLSVKYGLKGPNFSIVTACTTGTHNIGEAFRVIEYGDADVMIAGGSEMCTTPTGLGGFSSAKALSKRNDDPQGASRPWDKDRDGFVLSDGAGIVVLEEYEHAKQRGAKIYAELIGFGMSGDAYHMTSPPADGEGAKRCMQIALKNAEINPSDVDYINAHGTSTPAGDIAETRAIKGCFDDHAQKLAISSTKSMTGHMVGAAGGIEAIFSVLALQNQVIPQTINIDNPDPECDLDYVSDGTRNSSINVVMSNSFGFGGTNGTLVFKKV